VGNVVSDVAKTALVIPNASYKSLTKKDIVKIEYDTKVGSTLGGINKLGIDSGHTALQVFANGVTGGYASKLHEKAVPGIVASQKKEQNEKIFSSGILSKIEDPIKKYAPVVGALGTSVLKSKPKTGSAPAAPPSSLITTIPQSDMGNTFGGVAGGIFTTANNVLSQVNEVSKTPIGQALTGVLGGVVGNLIKPKQGTPSTIPQQAALKTGKSPAIAESSKLTVAQQAVFSGKGIKIDIPIPGEATWWDKNKSWLIPVLIGVPGLFITLIMLFKRRR